MLLKAKKRFSKLEAYFEANKLYAEARQFTYTQLPEKFTWKADQFRWKFRERGLALGRLTDIHASAGEIFYLRMMLMHSKGATSYSDLRTVNGIVYSTFKEACDAFDILKDDRQWHVNMLENVAHAMPCQLRHHFVHILSNNQIADPRKLWQEHWSSMSEDILYSRRRLSSKNDLQLRESDIQNLSFAGIF